MTCLPRTYRKPAPAGVADPLCSRPPVSPQACRLGRKPRPPEDRHGRLRQAGPWGRGHCGPAELPAPPQIASLLREPKALASGNGMSCLPPPGQRPAPWNAGVAWHCGPPGLTASTFTTGLPPEPAAALPGEMA